VPAIVEAWYPGQAGGQALADVLFGDFNQAGRLPVTFYRSVEDLPPYDDYAMSGRTYRFFEGEPLFAFGHGLSYTRFEMGSLRIDRPQVAVGEQVTVAVEVSNSGDRAGDEVVQLYTRHPDAAVPRPRKELAGFKRISLEPGQRKRVAFALHTHQLGYYGSDMKYAVHPGRVEVLLGRSSQDLPLRGQIEIVGERSVVEKVFFSEAREMVA
jgi:beta-glucosidase